MRRVLIALVPLIALFGCTLAKVQVNVVSERTTLENQVLGSYNSLNREVLTVASVRGVDPLGRIEAPPRRSGEQEDVAAALQTIAFHSDDLDAFKRLGWVGENNEGLLTSFPMVRDDVPERLKEFAARYKEDEFAYVVGQINEAREKVMRRVVQVNETFTQDDLPKIPARFRQAQPGERFPGRPGAGGRRRLDGETMKRFLSSVSGSYPKARLALLVVLVFTFALFSGVWDGHRGEGTATAQAAVDSASSSEYAPKPETFRKNEQPRPRRLPVNTPLQFTFESDPVLYAAVSRDGKQLAYVTERGGVSSLRLRSADPSVVVLPRRIATDPGKILLPAFSPDGRWIAYVGTSYDAKGDIFLMSLGQGRCKAPASYRERYGRRGALLLSGRRNPGFPPESTSRVPAPLDGVGRFRQGIRTSCSGYGGRRSFSFNIAGRVQVCVRIRQKRPGRRPFCVGLPAGIGHGTHSWARVGPFPHMVSRWGKRFLYAIRIGYEWGRSRKHRGQRRGGPSPCYRKSGYRASVDLRFLLGAGAQGRRVRPVFPVRSLGYQQCLGSAPRG